MTHQVYEAKPNVDVVCFRSQQPDALGFRTAVLTVRVLHPNACYYTPLNLHPTTPYCILLQVDNADEMQFDLPPGATITLERVDEPGCWRAFDGVAPACRCFTVSFRFVC